MLTFMVTAQTLRVFATLFACLPPLGGADLTIDHVTVAGASLANMRQAFSAAIGIATQYGGRHANNATEMALASFPDGSYVELMAIAPRADTAALAAHEWRRFLTGNAGPCGFALRTKDLPAEAASLRSRGIAVGAAVPGGRTRPDGYRLQWETADVGPSPRGSLFPFLIADVTPRKNRVYPSGTPTTDRFAGIAAVVVGVSDLEKTIAEYRRAFNLPEPLRMVDRNFGATLAWFEGTPFVLAEGLDANSWLTKRVRAYGEAPCAFILASATGPAAGGRESEWFGHAILWTDEQRLGWRLGVETLQR